MRPGPRPEAVLGVLLALGLTLPGLPAAYLSADTVAPAIRITSPLGRTGLPGTIRIVARLQSEDAAPLQVDFYVDRVLLRSDVDGPPFDAHWTDDNPYEPRELMVQARLSSGATLTDTLLLTPLQLTEAAEITSVAVEASVVDREGRFMPGLIAGDFELFENGEPQPLDQISPQRVPALFAVLVDSSQSMAVRADAVLAAAARLIDPLAPDDQLLVAPFTRRLGTVTGPTTDRATILDAIRAIRHGGGTAILDSLRQTASALEAQDRRRAVILLTDGYDEHSASAFEATIAALREANITLYVVGMGGVAGISLKGETLLTRLAAETGGRAWFPRDERHLLDVYRAIASDVRHKYLLTYTPRNQQRDGAWRAIHVNVRTPGARVRARSGYSAPLAPPVRTSHEFLAIGAGQTPVSLTRDEVIVLEDGIEQEVDTFHEAVLPVTIMLALDSSGSMKRSAEQAKAAARDFIVAMRPEDEVGMIMFANESKYVHSPTVRRDWSLAAIDRYTSAGGTALYDALYDSLAQLQGVSGRRVVVVVTDGRDENASSSGPGSRHTWDDVLAKQQTSDATVYAVGVGPRVDKPRLQQLANASGGAAFFPADVTALTADYHKILEELRRRWVVGYESKNRRRDGRWRTVDIRARGTGIAIRSRGGYYAPAR